MLWGFPKTHIYSLTNNIFKCSLNLFTSEGLPLQSLLKIPPIPSQAFFPCLEVGTWFRCIPNGNTTKLQYPWKPRCFWEVQYYSTVAIYLSNIIFLAFICLTIIVVNRIHWSNIWISCFCACKEFFIHTVLHLFP